MTNVVKGKFLAECEILTLLECEIIIIRLNVACIEHS